MFSPSDHAARERVWLLDLTWGDVVYHLCADQMGGTYTDADGDITEYQPGLVVATEIERDESVKAPLALHLGGVVDVPERISQGHRLEAARGVLWLWLRGTDHREIIADGYVDGAEYGEADEPVTVELVDDRIQNDDLFPPTTARMRSSAQNPGEFYPWIIGKPGISKAMGSAALVWSDDGGTPPLAVEILVAGHPVEASHVRMVNADTGQSETRFVTEDTDSTGRTVSVVDVTSAPSWVAADRAVVARYFTWWSDVGLAIRGAAAHGAGDVIRWALERTDVAVDTGALAAIIPALNRYKISAAVQAAPDQRINLWGWIQEHVLSLLPLISIQSDLGLRFVIARWDAGEDDVTATLTEGENAERVGGVAFGPRADVRNEIRLAYARDARSFGYTRTVVISGDDVILQTEVGAKPSRVCKESTRAHGRRVWEGSTDVVYDDNTATMIARQKAQQWAIPPRFFGYIVPPDVGSALDIGDIVALTSDRLHLTSLRCMVVDKPASDGEFYGLKLREITG